MTEDPRMNATVHIGLEDILINGEPFPCYLLDEPVTVVNATHDMPDAVPLYEVSVTLMIPSGQVTIDPGLVVTEEGAGSQEVATERQVMRRTPKDEALGEFITALRKLLAAPRSRQFGERPPWATPSAVRAYLRSLAPTDQAGD